MEWRVYQRSNVTHSVTRINTNTAILFLEIDVHIQWTFLRLNWLVNLMKLNFGGNVRE